MKETYVASSSKLKPYTFEVYHVDEIKFGENKVPEGNLLFEGEWGLGDSLIASGILLSEHRKDHGVLFLFNPENVPQEEEEFEDEY